MNLDQVIVTNETIEIYNLTSIGTNFTNINNTYDAVINFLGLKVDLTLRNINTSSDVFTSIIGSQDYNATLTPWQLLRVMGEQTDIVITGCSNATRAILNLIMILFALAIVLIPIGILFRNGTLSWDTDPKQLLIIFIGVILGVIFLQEIGRQIFSFCPL